jgi:ATP-dependent DNA helicase RecQ
MLDLRLVTVSYDPESGAFPESPLADLPGEIVSVVEHFFFHDGLPRLLLVVQHHPKEERAAARGTGRRAPRADPRLGLTGDEAAFYDRLRTWRRGRAEADGVPPYVILNNRELAELARRRPTSLTALRDLEGIGQNKAQRYGPDLLQLLAAAPAEQAPPAEGTDGPA